MVDWIESPARLPGWYLLRNPDTKSIKYKSPSGDIVGTWAYKSAGNHFERTGVVPQEPLGNKWRSASKSLTGSSSTKQSASDEDVLELPIPGTEEVIGIDLPEPKNTTSAHKKSGLFTSKELSNGFQSVLVIATSILAMVLQTPEAQMSNLEVKAIGIPLGNIVERSKYNRFIGQMVVEKSDYLQLGYALYMYTDRVTSAVRERNNAKSSGNVATYQPAGTTGGNGSGGGNPVPLRTASSGLRGFQQ